MGNFDPEFALRMAHSVLLGRKYEVLDLSNVGDWLAPNEFLEVVRRVIQDGLPAKPGRGKLILRRLLGDYDLLGLTKKLAELGLSVSATSVFDRTQFYSQTVILTKLESTVGGELREQIQSRL